MDNFQIDITSEGDKSLSMAMEIAWRNAPGGLAMEYRVERYTERTAYYTKPDGTPSHHSSSLQIDHTGVPTLILLWNKEQASTPLPYPLSLSGGIEFVRGWLAQSDIWGAHPDHDGSNGKGWRVFTEDWGHVAGHHYSIVAIQPAWAMYGK